MNRTDFQKQLNDQSMKTRYIVSLAAVFALIFTSQLNARERLVISQPFSNSATQYISGERILKEAYSRIEIAVEFRIFPAARSLVMANTGKTDGEYLRIAGIDRRYPNLVMIPVPIRYLDVVVYTQKAEFTVDGWQSLSPYNIGIVRGFKIAEINTKDMNVEIANTVEQAFLKLNAGRSDILVDLRTAQCRLKSLDVSGIRILEPPVARLVLYHYVHKRHTALAAKLEEVLTRMEQTGELQSIRDKADQEIQDICQ